MLKWKKDGHLQLMRKASPAFSTTVEEEEKSSRVGITSYKRMELSQEK